MLLSDEIEPRSNTDSVARCLGFVTAGLHDRLSTLSVWITGAVSFHRRTDFLQIMTVSIRLFLTIFLLCMISTNLKAKEMLIIDNRVNNDLQSDLGNRWRFIADGVMGGVSDGSLAPDSIEGRSCLRLRGTVRLDNNGGFIQAALDIGQTQASNASGYQGLLLDVYGNDNVYNLHLRTDDVWLPWQSYRASFQAPARWHSVKIPFEAFSGYRISKKLDITQLRRIGIVAIGRAFAADLCIGKLAFY